MEHKTIGSLVHYASQFKGTEYPIQLAQALLCNGQNVKGTTGCDYVVKKCIELLQKIPDPEEYARRLELCYSIK